MKFSLIICTYKRPNALKKLLYSIQHQTLYPDEIIIVDGSPDDKTEKMIKTSFFRGIKYFHVDEQQRGLTKQRNFGVRSVNRETDIICFLDDDIILTNQYFQILMSSYEKYPEAGGVGGYIIDEISPWKKGKKNNFIYYNLDGYNRKLPKRFLIRKILGLFPNRAPGFMPDFSHGLSIGYLPPIAKIYPVEFFMGGVSSYKKEVLIQHKFSHYFEGYGLYEDLDYCLRISKKYKLYVNTAAQLYHYHEPTGRPNHYRYGRMVVRNGWYVWRVKYPNPSLKARFKWNATAILLASIRLTNIFSIKKGKGALLEAMGRFMGLVELVWNKPTIQR